MSALRSDQFYDLFRDVLGLPDSDEVRNVTIKLRPGALVLVELDMYVDINKSSELHTIKYKLVPVEDDKG